MENKVFRKEMRELISKWSQEGITQISFCKREGIGLSKFRYWHTKFQLQAINAPSFIPVEVLQENPIKDNKSKESIQITYPNGVKIELPSLDLSILRSLIYV